MSKLRRNKIFYDIGLIIGVLLVWSAVYLLFSFLAWNFNPMDWWLFRAGFGRFITSIIVGFGIVFSWMTIDNNWR